MSKSQMLPVEHLLVSVLGKNWKKVFVVAFTVYLDDNGTDPKQPIANATALIIPANKIVDMEKELEALKKKEGFTDFHTSPFVFRNLKSEFANWKDGKHKRVFRRMRQITRKYTSQVFSMAVYKDDYDSVVPSPLRDIAGKSHFAWALRHVLSLAQAWRISDPSLLPYEWIFDWMEKHDKSRMEVEIVMEQTEEKARTERNVTGDYVNLHFRPRASLAGLQCADLVAWTNYQFALKVLRGKQLHPFAQKAWQDFSSMPQHAHPNFASPLDWNEAVFINRDELKAWAQKETADGMSIKWGQEWEARKQTGKAKPKGTPSARRKRSKNV